jgi:hypothetical protein
MSEENKDIDLKKNISELKEEFEVFKSDHRHLIENIEQFTEKLKKENKKLEKPFEMLNLPSKGFFYENKNSYILIGYLTYIEENLLTSEMLVESGIAYEVAFENLICNNDITIDELLTGDVQAMALALRSFSYGNNIELDLKCEHCEKIEKATIPLTSFQMRSVKNSVDENGEVPVDIAKGKISLKIKPITFKDEIALLNKKDKKPLEELAIYIKEFNGERNPNKILNIIRMLRLLESRELREAIKENTPGVDTKYYYECDHCDKTTLYDFGGNTFDLLKLPASYRNNVLEEMFLLTYYGKSITIEDAKQMPVTERRWFINRISEELDKQREYEKKEMAKAKSSSKKR